MKLFISIFTLALFTSSLMANENPCFSKPSIEFSDASSLVMGGGGGGGGSGGSGGTSMQEATMAVGKLNPCLLVENHEFKDLVLDAAYHESIEIDGRLFKPSVIDLKGKTIVIENSDESGNSLTIGVKPTLSRPHVIQD